MTLPFTNLFGTSSPVVPGGTYWWAAAFSEVTGIPSEEAFGTPSLGKIVGIEGIESGEEFGSTVLMYNQDIAFTSIDEGGVGEPVVANAENQVFRTVGIPSREAVGAPELILGWLLEPVGIESGESFGLTAIPSPPRFDSVGAGWSGNTGFASGFSYSHNGTASAYLVVDIVTDTPPPSMTVTYGGLAMTQLASVDLGATTSAGAGHFWRFGLANIAGGPKTVAVSFYPGLSINASSNSRSYLGVSSVGSAETTALTQSGSLSQSAITSSAQMAVQTFAGDSANGARFASIAGGTNRYNSPSLYAQLSLSDSAASAVTFTATATTSSLYPQYWVGCVNKLLASIPQIDVPSLASGEAFGTPTVLVASPQTVTASAISSGEAFGTLAMVQTQFLTLTGIASAGAFGTAQLNQAVTGTGIASAEAFGSATVAAAGVSFDASAVGAFGSTTALTWSHTLVATGDVFATVVSSSNVTVSAITCGGSAMTLVTSINNNATAGSGATRLYRLSGVSAGSKTISVTFSGSTNSAGSSVSYTGVASVGTATTASGTGFNLSQAKTLSAGQWILQTFGAASASLFSLSSPAGGTNRTSNSTGSQFVRCMISDATANTTFTASSSDFGTAWGGLAVILS